MSRPTPEEVFTPKTVVTKTMFEARNEPDLNNVPGLQDRLKEALREQGSQILIYGDTGVGKSSLLTNVAELVGRKTVEVDCTSGMTIDDIIEHATAQVLAYRKVGRTRTATVEGEAGVEGKLPFFAAMKSPSSIFRGTTVDVRRCGRTLAGSASRRRSREPQLPERSTRCSNERCARSDPEDDWTKPSIRLSVRGPPHPAIRAHKRGSQPAVGRIPDPRHRAVKRRGQCCNEPVARGRPQPAVEVSELKIEHIVFVAVDAAGTAAAHALLTRHPHAHVNPAPYRRRCGPQR